MPPYLIATNLAAVTLAAVFGGLFLRYRHRLHREQGRLAWPIPTVDLQDFDPAFRHDEFGSTPEAEAVLLGVGDGVLGGTSGRESWVLAVLAKRARSMFEFGTCTGRSTYLWARNSPPDAQVVTLTLAPADLAGYRVDTEDERRSAADALGESRFTRFRYTGTPVESKVRQLFGDSKAFDDTPYRGAFDVIFIDGSHAYSYVRSDTEKALKMIKPGGVVLWHDYRGSQSGVRGVYRYLNELSRSLSLVHLRGTTLVAYRAPGPA